MAVDGTPGPWAGDLSEPRPGRPFASSPDGRHLAWVGKFDHVWRPVVDDRIGPGSPGVSMPVYAAGRVEFGILRTDGVHRASAPLEPGEGLHGEGPGR